MKKEEHWSYGNYQTFEESFHVLLDKAKKGPVSVRTFLTLLSGRGKDLLLIFLSLGFSQIPGVATFLGLFIVYLGFKIAIGRTSIWLPKALLSKKLPSYLLIKISRQTLRFLKFIKRWSHPRLIWATQLRLTRVLNGLMIVVVGIALAASPPIPLTGFISFFAIFFIAIGLLNDDGIYILIGYAFTLFYAAVVFFLLEAFDVIKNWLGL